MRTQFNIRLPDDHLARLEAMRERAGLSQSEMVMRLVDAEHSRQHKCAPLYVYPRVQAGVMEQLDGRSRYQLDDLAEAAQIARLECWAADLRQRGIPATTHGATDDERLAYICVYAPDDNDLDVPSSMFADEDEACHLLDFVRNLSPAEAYRRWYPTVKPPAAGQFWRHGYFIRPGRIRGEIGRIQQQLTQLRSRDDVRDNDRIEELERLISDYESELLSWRPE